jgi:hypothetical protein
VLADPKGREFLVAGHLHERFAVEAKEECRVFGVQKRLKVEP